jgi:hypothetical protein
MSKNWIAITFAVFFSCGGISQAHPLDSPDIVYIDGLPCNAACQSYMKWSRQQTSPVATLTRRSSPAFHHTSVKRRQRSEPLPRARIAGQAAPKPPIRVAEPRPDGKAEVDSELARASATASSSADGATAHSRALRAQVADATTFAERVTRAAAELAPVNTANAFDRAKSTRPGDAERTPNVSSNPEENIVALVMARPEIKSVADLAGKDVAIDEPHSALSGVVRTAIAAAGAADVQLSPRQTKAIDRLIKGEVQAAVLTLVSKEAGEWFPQVAGFRVFRVPLSPVH